MKRYIISAALFLCNNALAMNPAKSLFVITNAANVNTHDLKPTLEAMIAAHEQTRMRNKRCTLARLLHCTSNCITSKNSVFITHTEECLELKAKL